nr:hypothetical protein [Microbacterium oleivorans]
MPQPYSSAVSKCVTPSSWARRIAAINSVSSLGPYPNTVPMAPYPIADEVRPRLPMARCCMLSSFQECE